MTEMTALSPDDTAPVDAETERYLRADAIVKAINAAVPGTLTPIPKGYLFKKRDTEVVKLSLNAAYQLIGGLPRLVAVADEDPKWFYGMWSRQLGMDAGTANTGTTVIVQSALPATAHDRVSINEAGEIVIAETQLVDSGLPE